jgi:anaerobic selenocysteine-containing dehydrogenase
VSDQAESRVNRKSVVTGALAGAGALSLPAFLSEGTALGADRGTQDAAMAEFLGQTDLPVPPANATVHTSACQFCNVGCGYKIYTWPVSTGVRGTPSGTYRPQSLDRNHRSNLYGSAPMPYSIFYSGNFAIHGTVHVDRLGTRASHGCIRLHPSNAAVLFGMVQRQPGSTTIQIH